MNIRDTFLSLTDRTYPHGTEHQLFDKLPQNLDMDDFGNLFIKIGESDVMFTSHLDTATSNLTDVNHLIDGKMIKTDGKSILGADDKAGVTIMINMIERKIPGLYYFFLGEEVGCVGSKKVAEKHKSEKIPFINKVVSFDRRGTDSVITFQASSRCCSDKFAESLAAELNRVEDTFSYKKDPTGVYTDSAQFVKIYPECTNISVGYYSEHTHSESQNIEHLEALAEACCNVNWASLPVERDPSVTEYSSYGGYGGYYGYDGYGWDWDYNSHGSNSFRSTTKRNRTEHVYDAANNHVTDMEFDTVTGDLVKVTIHPDRMSMEQELIENLFDQIDLDYDRLHWDGVKLKVYSNAGKMTEYTRNEMKEYIEELDLSRLIEVDNDE